MPKLDTIRLTVRTGGKGLAGTPKYSINGFPLDFDEIAGGAEPGETLEAVGRPESFPHSLLLLGPSEGEWEIAGIDITYECFGEEPYAVRLGEVTLDANADLNIWHARPARVIDV